jgi:hypothetical protein
MVLADMEGVLYGSMLTVPTGFEARMAACVYEIASSGLRFMSAIGFGLFSTPPALPRDYIVVVASPDPVPPSEPYTRAQFTPPTLEIPFNYAGAYQALAQNGDYDGSPWVSSTTAEITEVIPVPAIDLVAQTGQFCLVGFRPAATVADEATYAVVVTQDIDPGTEIGVAAGVLLPSGISGTEVFRWRAGTQTVPAGSVLVFSHIRGELPGSTQPAVTVASGSRNPHLDVGSVETFAYPSEEPITSLIAFSGAIDDFDQIVNMAYTIFYTGVFPEGLRGYLLPLYGVCPPSGGVWLGNTRVRVCGADEWRVQTAALNSLRPLPWAFQNLPFFYCAPCSG